jgi:hypothetical protein
MTIKKIKEETIEQSCDNCGNIRDIAIDELTLGVVVEEHTIPNVIRLPTCDLCSTTEYLFVSEDAMKALMSQNFKGVKSTKSQHQLLVDQLAEEISLLNQ